MINASVWSDHDSSWLICPEYNETFHTCLHVWKDPWILAIVYSISALQDSIDCIECIHGSWPVNPALTANGSGGEILRTLIAPEDPVMIQSWKASYWNSDMTALGSHVMIKVISASRKIRS